MLSDGGAPYGAGGALALARGGAAAPPLGPGPDGKPGRPPRGPDGRPREVIGAAYGSLCWDCCAYGLLSWAVLLLLFFRLKRLPLLPSSSSFENPNRGIVATDWGVMTMFYTTVVFRSSRKDLRDNRGCARGMREQYGV